MPVLLSNSQKFMASGAMVIAVLALLFAVATQATPCASAAAGSCSVGDLETFTSAITVNTDLNDADTIISGDTVTNLLYVDAGNDAVLVGASAPVGSEAFYVLGDARIDGDLVIDTVAKGSVLGGTAADTLGVLAVGTNDFVLTADSAQTTGLKWAAVAAGGGITELDQWRLTTSFTGDASPIASNLERVDTNGFSQIGTGMTESSGLFTFPSTGIWRIEFHGNMVALIAETSVQYKIFITVDDSSYTQASVGYTFADKTNDRSNGVNDIIFDVTSVSTHKVRFDITSNAGTVQGSTSINETWMTFTRIGDT